MLLLNKQKKTTANKSIEVDYLLKIFIDRTVAFVLIILLAPIMLLVAIAVKLDSPGEIIFKIFKQIRIGLNGRQFNVWKFRSMLDDSKLLQQQLEGKNEERSARN